MQDRVLNPIGIEESILAIRLYCQGADAFYLAELRLAEKMKPGRLKFMVRGKAERDQIASRSLGLPVTCPAQRV